MFNQPILRGYTRLCWVIESECLEIIRSGFLQARCPSYWEPIVPKQSTEELRMEQLIKKWWEKDKYLQFFLLTSGFCAACLEVSVSNVLISRDYSELFTQVQSVIVTCLQLFLQTFQLRSFLGTVFSQLINLQVRQHHHKAQWVIAADITTASLTLTGTSTFNTLMHKVYPLCWSIWMKQ